MSKKNLFGKGVVLGIMFLFVGMSILPITGSIEIEKPGSADKEVISEGFNRDETTIYVDDDNTEGPWDGSVEYPYRYIQDGIDNANDGDTVYVYNGTYYGDYYSSVEVDKSINLIGEDKDATFIEVYDYVQFGAVAISADYVNITGFTIRNAYGEYFYVAGISVRWSNYCNISRNNIINNKNGIDAYHSPNITISGNTIVDNGFLAISSRASSGSTISGNTITNNYYGISLPAYENEPRNIISENTITNNYIGIYLIQSFNNIIFGNNITDNELCGIYLLGEYSSNNNFIYHNNFINNTQNAYDACDGFNNFWYNSTLNQGNYWSDYEGDDVEPPYGIGDTPYNIPGGDNQDIYPLMNPWNGTILITPKCGDVNNDEIIDVGDVVYLINYLFKNGPEPQPELCIGDCNSDEVVDLGDVVYLINYLFKGGPEPEGCCRS